MPAKDKRTKRKGNELKKKMILTHYIPIKTVTYGVYVYTFRFTWVCMDRSPYMLISEVNI